MRNKKSLFEFIWDEIIYGSGGDGEGYIFLKDTPAETLAKEFYKWVDSEKGLQGFTLSERDGHYYVWDNQEGFVFTNRRYTEDAYPYADMVLKIYQEEE